MPMAHLVTVMLVISFGNGYDVIWSAAMGGMYPTPHHWSECVIRRAAASAEPLRLLPPPLYLLKTPKSLICASGTVVSSIQWSLTLTGILLFVYPWFVWATTFSTIVAMFFTVSQSRSRGSMMKSLVSASSTCPHTAPISSSKVKVASSPSPEEKVKLSLPGWSRKVKVVSLKTRVQEITVSSSHILGRVTSSWSLTGVRNSAEASEVKKTKLRMVVVLSSSAVLETPIV